MTTAVCFKCGAMKVGALVKCHQCGERPNTGDDCVRSVWMTDHYFDSSGLERLSTEVKEGKTPRPEPAMGRELLMGLLEAQEAAPELAAAAGVAAPPPDSRPQPRRGPSLEEIRRIPELNVPVLEHITPAEWDAASGNPMAMTQLILQAKMREAPGAQTRGGPTEKRSRKGLWLWLAASLLGGVIAGAVLAADEQGNVIIHARTPYSDKAHSLYFPEGARPSEEEILDDLLTVVNYREKVDTGIDFRTSKDWRNARADGLYLTIPFGQSKSVVIAPYDPAVDLASFSKDDKGAPREYVWLTTPATRALEHIPGRRVEVFLLAFVATAAGVFTLRFVWYFLLNRLRELVRAVRGV